MCFTFDYCRSGTGEEYTEREAILQDVVDLFNAKDAAKAASKAAAAQPKTDIRKRAMETLKGVD